MAPIRSLMFATLTSVALAACATPADDAAARENRSAREPTIPAKPPAQVSPPTAPGEEPIMKCDDSNTDWAHGKVADEPLVTRIREQTHARAVRVIKPGMMVTMDYREDRVNIDVDDNNKVVDVRCG